MARPFASTVLGLTLALVIGGCGSDDSPQPYRNQAKVAARALDRAGAAIDKAGRSLADEPNVSRLGAVKGALDQTDALVDESAQHVETAIEVADEDSGEAGLKALTMADRAARRAADAANRANEALIDASERLGMPYGKIVSPATDSALDQASDSTNKARLEVLVARGAAE